MPTGSSRRGLLGRQTQHPLDGARGQPIERSCLELSARPFFALSRLFNAVPQPKVPMCAGNLDSKISSRLVREP